MINIQIDEKKPEFYGSSGLHLYSVKSEKSNNNRTILIDEKNKGITLYKQYDSILAFLSNEIDLYPSNDHEGRIETYPVYGNPKYMRFLNPIQNDMQEVDFYGYLDASDVRGVSEFLDGNALDEEQGIRTFYDTLSERVKEHLDMCLGDEAIPELVHYFKTLVQFFRQASNARNEVIIIANG